MGLILQAQRGAIERLQEFSQPLPRDIGFTSEFRIGKSKIFYLGPSEGIGTCSAVQFHGMWVAVFGYSPEGRAKRDSHFADCEYPVLVRNVTEKEREMFSRTNGNHGMSILAVELIWVKKYSDEFVQFALSGKVAVYVNI